MSLTRWFGKGKQGSDYLWPVIHEKLAYVRSNASNFYTVDRKNRVPNLSTATQRDMFNFETCNREIIIVLPQAMATRRKFYPAKSAGPPGSMTVMTGTGGVPRYSNPIPKLLLGGLDIKFLQCPRRELRKLREILAKNEDRHESSSDYDIAALIQLNTGHLKPTALILKVHTLHYA